MLLQDFVCGLIKAGKGAFQRSGENVVACRHKGQAVGAGPCTDGKVHQVDQTLSWIFCVWKDVGSQVTQEARIRS
jgi:hypothetical protein